METSIGELLTPQNMVFAGAVFALTTALKKALSKWLSSVWGERLLPLLPLVVGVGLALCGLASVATLRDQILMGLLAGSAAAHGFKIGKTTVLGKGLSEAVESALPEEESPPKPSA